MNISTDLDQVSPDFSKPPNGYEWWYFDGLSTDGKYGFVIIFYHDNPFSTKKIAKLERSDSNKSPHPAISISIYRNNKTIYYSFLEFDEKEFDWDKDELRLTIENHSFQYDIQKNMLCFEMKIDQELASGHSLRGEIKGQGGLTPSSLIESKSKDDHMWNLILPVFEFEADLSVNGLNGKEELILEGRGYHDHNTGHEPMKDSFKDWYWGRSHFENFTLIYYLMEKHDSQQLEAWLIDAENQTVLEYMTDAELSYRSRNWFGLNSARKIELKSSQVSVNIQCKDKIDDGPFYQRFGSDFIINYNGQINAAQGFSEYIYPKNIYRKLFWPLVQMRLRYVGEKPHWVQKSLLLYPWTW
jgi:carotenoid 1,2-hydratase